MMDSSEEFRSVVRSILEDHTNRYLLARLSDLVVLKGKKPGIILYHEGPVYCELTDRRVRVALRLELPPVDSGEYTPDSVDARFALVDSPDLARECLEDCGFSPSRLADHKEKLFGHLIRTLKLARESFERLEHDGSGH